MGLIDRLNQDDSDKGVFQRALSMRAHRAPDPQHDRNVDGYPGSNETIPPQESEIVPGAAVRSLLKELQTQRYFGITTPSHLFSLMHRHLLVKRGAFLVPHRDGGMVPIATAGLDRTSGFRIRLNEEELVWVGDGRSAVILDDSRRMILSERLSRADAKRTPRIALFPFVHLRETVAILLVFDSPVLQMDPNVLDVIVGALSESAGKLLFDGRQRPMDHRERSSTFRAEHIPAIISRLEERAFAESRAVEILEIDLNELVATILAAHPHLDQARLLEDVLDTIALLTEPAHTAVHVGGQRVYLLGLTQPSASAKLIVHLLAETLGALFGCNHPRPLTYTVRDAEELKGEV